MWLSSRPMQGLLAKILRKTGGCHLSRTVCCQLVRLSVPLKEARASQQASVAVLAEGFGDPRRINGG
jgi:hypothetical protein